MTEFDHYSPQTLQFLADLKANNSRDWFADHRTIYDVEIKEPTKHFASSMQHALQEFTGQSHHAKIYRIHRDVRFSKDKTPYNAHVHLSFIPDMRREDAPMWHFGLAPDKLSLGCGVFQFGKAGLDAFRQVVDGPKGAELMNLTEKLRGAGVQVAEPELKRVPAGFDKDHPHSEALRRKGITGWIHLDDPAFAVQPDLVARCIKAYHPLTPIYDFLSDLA